LVGTNGTGNGLANVLTGNAANNTLDGGAGADALAGGLGDDTYIVDDAGDRITEAADQGADLVRASVTYRLRDNLETLVLTGRAALDGSGNGGANVILGNAASNMIDGGAGADRMEGGAGSDTYVVDDEGDLVVEAAGDGIDEVRSALSHTLGANVENLVLTGNGSINGTGNDLKNLLSGNGGANVLDGGAGVDTMTGGAGDDTYVVDSLYDVVVEAANGGTDTVLSSVTWVLGAELERLTLTGAANTGGTGNGLANVLTGNAGNNALDGAAGADTMAGGLGNDTYVVDNAGDVVTEGADGGIDSVSSSITWTLGANIERLTLTGLVGINGTGNGLANVLTGNAANNTLDGGAAADTMAGGLGDDTYIVDDAGDRITEAADQGTDMVRASVTYRLRDNLETLVLTGRAALDGSGNGGANVILGNAASNMIDGGAGADRMEGGAGSDTYAVDDEGDLVVEAAGGGTDEVRSAISYTLGANVENLVLTGDGSINGTGNDLKNMLAGTVGANRLDGGLGNDTMYGGAGDDTYVVDAVGDRVVEKAGNGYDTVLSSVSYTLSAEVEELVLTGIGSIDGVGNGGANTLVGNGANNVLQGGRGADAMAGGDGDDTYEVDNAGDVVTELANGGTDLVLSWISHTLAANVESLTLVGRASIATGNDLANALTGNAGHNVLDGGLGADVLAGGGGGDTFRFSTALGPHNVDRIVAFDHAGDTIQLGPDVFEALGPGRLAAEAFSLGAVATQADDRILFDAVSKSLYYDADGTGGVDAVKFVTIDSLNGVLDHTDFLIV
jgi:Ca2+-binding RTX toxin-like protein